MFFFQIFSIASGLLVPLQILRVVADRIVKAFSICGATRTVALDICKSFRRMWHAGLLWEPKFDGVS